MTLMMMMEIEKHSQRTLKAFLPSTVDEKLMNSFHTRQHSQQKSVCIDDEG